MSMNVKKAPAQAQVYTAAATKSEKLSDTQRNAIWEDALKANVDRARNPPADPTSGKKFYMGDSRIDKYEGKVKEDMKKWMAEHKDAKPEDIEKAVEDSISKRYGYEFVNKLTDDYFMGKIMARAKELQSEMWS